MYTRTALAVTLDAIADISAEYQVKNRKQVPTIPIGRMRTHPRLLAAGAKPGLRK